MNARIIPEVGPEHMPGLQIARQLARKYEDRQLLGFLIEVAQRKEPIDLSAASVDLYDGGSYLGACEVEEILEAHGLKVTT